MKLFLVRHGEAGDAFPDAQRSLTDRGIAQVQEVANQLQQKEVFVERILHSPRVRAIQTAEIIAKTLGFEGCLDVHEGLNPNDSVQIVADELQVRALKGKEVSLMLVGHLPFMGDLVENLLEVEITPIMFQTATIACLNSDPSGHWTAEYVISPMTAL